jgi:hypothetical protein
MTFTIKDSDKNAIRRFAKTLAGGALSVGILEGDAGKEHADSELTVGEVGEIHEFGLGVPRRSFLAGWVDEAQDKIVNVIVRGGQALAQRKITMPNLLEQTGAWAVGQIQERISNGIAPANAPSTIAQKGSSVPLIDTGQLRASITYKVEGQ